MGLSKFIPTRANRRTRIIPFPNTGDGSTLSLDFTTMSSLDSRFTFSRSSTATFINSSGLVQYADANLILQSESLSTSPWTPTNGASVADVSTTNPIGGSTATQLTSGGANNSVLQAPSLAANVPHTVRFWVRGGTSTQMQFGYFSGSFQTASGVTVVGSGSVTGTGLMTITGLSTTTWTQVTFVLASPAASGSLLFYPDTASPTVGRTNFVWGVQMNAGSTASAYNRTTTSAYHSPRFDYDPTTLARRGLLIEGSATNLALRSSDFNTTVIDGSQWTASGYSRGDVSTTLPDGTTGNACRILMASGSGSFRSASITVTASTAYTFSFWARNNGGSQARFRVWNVTAGSSIVDYTQTANNYVSQIGGANNTSSTWVRVSVSFTTPAGCTSIWVYPTSSDSGTVDLLVWGAQLEVTGSGTGPSSYIPTGSSTVQRAADSCSIALSSFGFNTEGGTFFADWYRKEYDVSSTGSGGPWNTDYASARWLGVQTTSANNAVFLGSWSGATSISNGATRNKAAATYGSWGGSNVPITFCVNGSAVSSGTRDFDPANPTRLMIGAASASSPYTTASRDFLNNSIRSIKYWPSILPNATLQSLTQ